MSVSDPATENHLVQLQTYLSKHLYNRPGVQCIRNELVTTYLRSGQNESLATFKNDRTCPRCFSPWNEGNFSLKIKSKKSKSNVNKRVIIKCLVCRKPSVIHRSSGTHGQRWKCAEDRKIDQHRRNRQSKEESSKERKFKATATSSTSDSSKKQQKRMFEATATSSASEMCTEGAKKRKCRPALKSSKLESSKVKRKTFLNESFKPNRRRKSKMTTKLNYLGVPIECDASRKKTPLQFLNDLL